MPISYQEALKIIQTHIHPVHAKQTLPLLKTINRIAGEDIGAKFALPTRPMSLKEGYGIAFKTDATHYTLLHSPYPTSIPLGCCVKLSTGDTIVEGIDAVVADEDVMIENEETITIPAHTLKTQNIKKEAEDIVQGELLLRQYERISAQKITALASQGITHIKTLKKLTVSLISIGNQLASGAIHNSNAMTLAARVIELGGNIDVIEVCEEDEKKILTILEKLAQKADVIITTGALSNHDAMRHLLDNKTLQTLFHHVRIAPAKPSALTLFHKKPILHLPGLPLASMLGFEILGVPLLRQLQHQASIMPHMTHVINQKRLMCRDDCMSAIPGYSDGIGFVSAPYYEAGRLNILSRCNGYIMTENKEVIEEGETLPFFYFTHPPVS